MVGPLFELEWLRANQRGRLDLLRRVYACILILELLVLDRGENPSLFSFAHRWLLLFLVQQFLLIVVLTPVFLAGTIGDEKARGALQFLLITDLNAWEILVDRCLGRLTQVAFVLSAGVPLLCFTTVLAGFPFTTAIFLTGFTVAFLFALGSASALAAVWTRQTRQAVSAVYIAGAALFLAIWALPRYAKRVPALADVHAVLRPFDLRYIFAPAWDEPDPSELARRLLIASVVWMLLGSVCLLLAVWRLRPAYLKQLTARPRLGRWLPRAEPSDEPIRWKEAHVERAVSIPLLGALPGWLAALLFFAAMLLWSGFSLLKQMDPRVLIVQQGVIVMFFASLMVGVRAAGAVTGERERNTWETLLTTPLDTQELLRGKLRGILDAVTPFLLAYGIFALIPSMVSLDVVSGVLTLMSLSATWLAMYLVGAAGILSSVRARSSGQSLLNTLITGYGFSNTRAVVEGSRAPFLVAAVVFAGTVIYQTRAPAGQKADAGMMLVCLVGLAVCLAMGPGLALWRRAQDYLDSAAIHVDKRERVRESDDRSDIPLGPYAEMR